MFRDSINVNMLALLVCQYLKSHIAELNAPDYIHTDYTQRLILHVAESYGIDLKFETEFQRNVDGKNLPFDLAFLDNKGEVVMLMEDENDSRSFLKEEIPKLAKGDALLKVGVTYNSDPTARIEIVEHTRMILRKMNNKGMFLLILGYTHDTKREDPYIRFDCHFFDHEGNQIWQDIDCYNRKVNFR